MIVLLEIVSALTADRRVHSRCHHVVVAECQPAVAGVNGHVGALLAGRLGVYGEKKGEV